MSYNFDPTHGLINVPVRLYDPAADMIVRLALDTGATRDEMKNCRWLKPELVMIIVQRFNSSTFKALLIFTLNFAQIEFAEWTPDGHTLLGETISAPRKCSERGILLSD